MPAPRRRLGRLYEKVPWQSSRLLRSSGRENECWCLSPWYDKWIPHSLYSPNWWKLLAAPTSLYDPVPQTDLARTPRQERGPLLQPSRKEKDQVHPNRRSQLKIGEDLGTPTLPPFPCDPKKVENLLDNWVRDRDITLPEVHHLSSCEEQEDSMHCPTMKRGHILEHCIPFRKVFDEKQSMREVSLQQVVLSHLPQKRGSQLSLEGDHH